MSQTAPQRVFFYVQHLLGIGHLRRAAAIARALVQAGAEVTFVSGGESVPGIDLGGARLVQLPPASAADSGFSAIVDTNGKPIDEVWQAERRRQLLAAFAAAQPDILLIEMYPFGRRPFRFELKPLLEAATTMPLPERPLVACSLRDILVDKGRADRRAETVALVERYLDLVLVHGDPRLVTFDRTFPDAGSFAAKLRYTGYVVEQLPPAADHDRSSGEILVSAGGGAVGAPLFAAAIAAKPLSRYRDHPWRLVTGRNLPASEAATVTTAAQAAGITVETFRGDFPRLLQSCLLSVSQGGYNTVMELIATRCPAVIVPFAEGSESEQMLRSRLLAERGILQLVDAASLTPAALAAAIDRAGRPADLAIDLDGAPQTATTLLSEARRRKGP